MKKFKERMGMPYSAFKRENMDNVIGSFKRCLNTADGDVIMKHLINEYYVDEPTGILEPNELAYRTACQDVVKYIISLTNDK